VDLTAQLAHGVNPQTAIALLKAALAQVPNVMAKPAPDVEILTFNLSGPVLAVRPYCNNEHYWQVYFGTNRRCVIRLRMPVSQFPAALHRAGAGRSQAREGGMKGAVARTLRAQNLAD